MNYVAGKRKMLFSEVPLWVGTEELRPGDLISVDLGRMLGERNVEYVGVYSDVWSGVRGILGKLDGKVLPLGSVSIFRKKVAPSEGVYGTS
jgi:hypothetical protein